MESKTSWVNFKNMYDDCRKSLERDLVIRRYHMWMQGRVPVEDRFLDFAVKIRSTFVISWRSVIKRFFDFLTALCSLIVLSPLMGGVALLIRLDSRGPILYKQVRVGKKGKCFNILKFRTMRQDAESLSGPVWAKENDPRVTRLGNFLRKTHLDELPQLINVIRGEMSLVGPRPERPHFVDEFRKVIPHYDRRLIVTPGITGLAQTKHHYDESLADVKRKLRYDVLYVEKMCPILDIKVIFATIGTVVFGTGR